MNQFLLYVTERYPATVVFLCHLLSLFWRLVKHYERYNHPLINLFLWLSFIFTASLVCLIQVIQIILSVLQLTVLTLRPILRTSIAIGMYYCYTWLAQTEALVAEYGPASDDVHHAYSVMYAKLAALAVVVLCINQVYCTFQAREFGEVLRIKQLLDAVRDSSALHADNACVPDVENGLYGSYESLARLRSCPVPGPSDTFTNPGQDSAARLSDGSDQGHGLPTGKRHLTAEVRSCSLFVKAECFLSDYLYLIITQCFLLTSWCTSSISGFDDTNPEHRSAIQTMRCLIGRTSDTVHAEQVSESVELETVHVSKAEDQSRTAEADGSYYRNSSGHCTFMVVEG